MNNSLKTLFQQLSENFNIPEQIVQNEEDPFLEDCEYEEIDEDNSGNSGGEYMTPKAFCQKVKDPDDTSYSEKVNSTHRFFKKIDDIYERSNAKVNRLNESLRLNELYSNRVDELSYQNYKEDDSSTERQKINKNILEINKKLREVEQMIGHASKLKLETGAGSDVYWKGTASSFLKIKERLTRLTNKIVEISG